METFCPQGSALAGKYLTFLLQGETYGLEILKVQEIIGLMCITRVPKTPEFIRGVFNLRGRVIPVIDLRLKFGLERVPDTERTCIVVVQTLRGGEALTVGIIVDEVSEVLKIDPTAIEETPSFGADVDTDFILGIGNVNQKIIMLLDVNRVLSGEESAEVAQAAGDLGV